MSKRRRATALRFYHAARRLIRLQFCTAPNAEYVDAAAKRCRRLIGRLEAKYPGRGLDMAKRVSAMAMRREGLIA